MLRIAHVIRLGLVVLSSAAYGQGTATIVGTVTDPTGAVVPNAKITITDLDNGFVRTTTTNSTGNYNAPELPPGHYQVQVGGSRASKPTTRRTSPWTWGTRSGWMLALQVGTVGQSVTVEANALQVQADTSEISQTITSNQIENLATNGRNVLQLTTLVPGASSNMPDFDSPGAQFQNRDVYFNGMRQDANNWLIDGGEAYDRGGGGILLVSPSQDALQELTIATSNYAADLGNSSGGMISMSVKSGTKKFHGGAWEYHPQRRSGRLLLLVETGGEPDQTGTPLQRVRIQPGRPGGVQVQQAQDVLLLQPGMAEGDQRRQHFQPGADRGTVTPAT